MIRLSLVFLALAAPNTDEPPPVPPPKPPLEVELPAEPPPPPTATPAIAAPPPAPVAEEPAGPPTAPPMITAVRVKQPPTFDGVVLGDPIWNDAPAATGLWQSIPDQGHPATEATEVRVVYTKDTLYIGVVCHDRTPAEMIVSGSRRDSSLDDSDAFLVSLDTFLDRQNGFVFGTNPAGIEFDGQVVNDGGGFNLNWDGSWEVRTQVGEFGWSAELAIPFRTLRYPGNGPEVWGINFQRNVRRRNEVSFWSPLPRQFDILHVSSSGTLVGIEVPAQRNLKLVPYVLREASRDLTLGDTRWKSRQAGGVDLKYSVSSSLTLDATVGTDFSQVEADEQQINLNRFNLYFPEKRPFFLENAGLFTVGDPGDVELFFSRRIGIAANGQLIPIVGGARLSGKLGPLRIGLLDMQTEEVSGVAPGNNFGVARLGWELPNRSSIGALFASRAATSGDDGGDPWNRTYALDGRWGIGRYAMVSGFVAQTDSQAQPGDAANRSAQLKGEYDSAEWWLNGALTYVGAEFNPEVGFLRRKNYRKAQGMAMYRYRPDQLLGFYELRPHIQIRGYFKPDGFHESGEIHVDNHWEWRNGYEVRTGMNFTHEGVVEPFEIAPGVTVPAGSYDHKEAEFFATTNQGSPVSLNLHTTLGGFFGGRLTTVEPRLRLRGGDTFSATVGWERNQASLPSGDFTTNLVRGRISYSFTTRLFAQALLQYNDRANLWSTNLRVGWLQTANAGLFVVYNENLDTEDWTAGWRAPQLKNRSLIMKLSLVVDVL